MRLIGFQTFAAGVMLCHAAVAAPPDCTDFWDNPRLGPEEQRWCQALAFKDKYLAGGRFVETAPPETGGSGRVIRSQLASYFSTNGTSRVEGDVTIGEISGFFRLQLATTDNTLFYDRDIRVAGTITAQGGPIEVYSPVDVDLWELAAVLVDRSDRNAPPPEEG